MSEPIQCPNYFTKRDILRSAIVVNGNMSFQVRGLVTFTPPDVTSCALAFWYDGQDAATFLLNGNRVIQWNDKSGNARHVTNAVDAQRPTWNAGTGRVAFVAANSTYLQSAVFPALVQPTTIIILYKITGGVGDNERVFDSNSDLDQLFYYTGNVFFIFAGAGVGTLATDANDNIHTGEFNGVNSNYWINGALVGNGNVAAGTINGVTMGVRGSLAALFADVDILEVIGYNCILTATERSDLRNYLTNKWSL